ncbi:hypothetical protein EXIGLDRAFT_831217 [Exidia glandulosa HHB12029]|uniref:F-box domain-containing protein n=1 Tax=Exidia glandulosa HHB12029 TaxID=1314781 RepID=A0A165MW18_EXIGL|nr:hypothetical protein EXIGLDRAFT_831217 [Exidia glandulosa HHB12029]
MVAPMLLRRASSKAMLAPQQTLRLQQSLAGQLPPEVLLMILAHLRPTRNPADAFHGDDIPPVDLALAGAPRVCRAWTAAAMYELYLEVPLPDFEACVSFLRTVRAQPALAARVHRVALPLCSTSRDGRLARHRARHCLAIKVFSDILHHLPNVRAVRVQDMHVIMIPGTLVHVEELVIDSRPAACVVVHAGCPPLLRAGDALRRVRKLTLLGAPSAIAWPYQEEYHLPALRVLCLRSVTAGLAAIHGLLQETRRTLREVTLDAVRAYAGTVPTRTTASIDEILVPVCETLKCLALARMPRRAGLDAFLRLESLSLDVQEDFGKLPLPPNLRHLDIHVDGRNLAPSPYSGGPHLSVVPVRYEPRNSYYSTTPRSRTTKHSAFGYDKGSLQLYCLP